MFRGYVLRYQLLIECLKVLFSSGTKYEGYRKENKITINNLDIFFLEAGKKGKTIIFLHGWGQSKDVWQGLIDELKDNYFICALDLPGFGKSNINKSLNVGDYSKIINDFIVRKKINKFILIGHSFGGTVAVDFALKHPEKISKLVIYSASIIKSKDRYGFLIDTGVKIIGSQFVSPIIKMYLYLRGKTYDRFKIYLETYVKQKQTTFDQKLKKLNVKTLLIYGKFDFLAPFSNGAAAKKLIKGAEYVFFDKSSHSAHLEEETKFLDVLNNFILSREAGD